MIGKKIAHKITSLGKAKSKEKEGRQEIYMPPEKRQQIIDDLRLFQTLYKNGIPKNYKLIRHSPWKWVEVYDRPGSPDDRYKPYKQIRFKTSMLRSDLCDFSDAYIVVKRDITLEKENRRGFIDIKNRFSAFKNNAPFT